MDYSVEDQMSSIKESLDRARKYGLDVEVVSTALFSIKLNPELEPSDAMNAACDEWDC